MRKTLLLTLALAISITLAMAVPAKKGNVRVKQPDGSYVTLQLHGDEWQHHTTTTDGYTVTKDSRGYYVYAHADKGLLQATTQVAHDVTAREAAEQAFLSDVKKHLQPEVTAENAAIRQRVKARQQQTLAQRRAGRYNYSNFKGLVILVQFNDRTFSRDDYADIMQEMINNEGYTGYQNSNGGWEACTGSVCDYFSDNSDGLFKPQFDIYGPYTINYSQYAPNGTSNAAAVVCAAINAADADIDYSQYDRDNDGMVDLVYLIFAGNGANYGGNDSRLFWPHRSIVNNNGYLVRKDGVYLYDYASSVELFGYTSQPQSVTIDGIGTICHEFSHVLGLPDFYDTDYKQSGGESNHPGIWSIMAGGSYENRGRTPVGYSLYERWSVGLAEAPTVINQAGSYTLNPLYSSLSGYRINTPVENEFFLLENRQKDKFKWDAYLPGSGMLVHRVDLTDESVWSSNKVNVNPARNYYEVVRAGGSSHSGTAYDLFPGTAGVTELHNSSTPANLKTWAKQDALWGLSNISMADNKISFTVFGAYELQSLTLPETLTVGMGLTRRLEAVATPTGGTYELTWTSSNPAVATVDQEGNVKGISTGTCTITVSGDNNCSATCEVTVIEVDSYTIGSFKTQTVGTELLLQLDNAEVLYSYGNSAYVRDNTGAIVFNNMGLSLSTNNRISGTIYAKPFVTNKMTQAIPTEQTNGENVSITAGSQVQPREVRFEDLTENDYADYVLIKGVQLVKKSVYCYAVSGDKQARVYVKFGSSSGSLPTNYDGKYYDVKGIWGTDHVSGQLIDELYLLGTPTEVEPSGIVELHKALEPDTPLYNLHGQRVGPDAKGILIRNGKKIVVR